MILLALAIAALPTTRQDPLLDSFEPSIEPAERTQVLVLGTPHLDTVAGFQPAFLASLLDLLEGWDPTAICVEALPGRTIALMLSEGETYAPVVTQFANGAAERSRLATDHLGLGRLEAQSAIALAFTEEEGLSDFDRALFFLAAYDASSAGLAWARATNAGEEPPDAFPEPLARFLGQWAASSNEITSLAGALALRLDLPRLDPVDDHLDKDQLLRIVDELSRELAAGDALAEAAAAAVYRQAAASLAECLESGDLLLHYLLLNGREFGRADVRAQWDVFLRTRLESKLDRTRLALWDVRNLNIASNIRRVTARNPGGRVLIVIGAGHKPFLESLLRASLDVEVVQLEQLDRKDSPARTR